MAEKDLLIKEKLDNGGIFSFSGFYSFAYGWLKYEDFDIVEEEYNEKISGNEKSLVIKWKASKSLSDYFKEEMAIKFEIRGLTEVEVEIDGVKKKTNKGTINVEIKGSLIRDKDSAWHGGWGWRFFREVYDRYVIPGRIYNLEQKVKGDVIEFKEQIKKYFELSGKR